MKHHNFHHFPNPNREIDPTKNITPARAPDILPSVILEFLRLRNKSFAYSSPTLTFPHSPRRLSPPAKSHGRIPGGPG